MKQNENNQQTKHIIVETINSEFFIISSLCTRPDTQILKIDKRVGEIIYTGKSNYDLFPSEEIALNFIKNNHKIKTMIKVPALIGIFRVHSNLNLLVATKVRKDLQLFGGHSVKTVVESNWIKIPLSFPFPEFKDQIKNEKTLQEFSIDGLHYYCDSLDITRPFPSLSPLQDYNRELCWNEWLAEPFNRVGLRLWCVVLLQGLAISRPMNIVNFSSVPVDSFDTFISNNNSQNSQNNIDVNSTNNVYSSNHLNQNNNEEDYIYLCTLTKKSNINPGTRYKARGLNKHGGPGNECECELILWKYVSSPSSSRKVVWYSFVYRRGTVPLWWETRLKSSVGEPEIVILEKLYQGSDTYYLRLKETYGQQPIFLYNMLRLDPNRVEYTLAHHFKESVNYVKQKICMDIKLISLDWHKNMKILGSDTNIETLWFLLKPAIVSNELNSGEITLEKMDGREMQLFCPSGEVSTFTQKTFQKGIIRFNCADSLDRTNVGCFLMCFQLMAEMARRMNIFQAVNAAAWSFLDYPLQQLLRSLPLSLVHLLADIFVLNGDVISMLYTNSPAMHSSLIREFSSNTSSALPDAVVAIKRRYQNVVNDEGRQSQYEMFLGLKLERYFPLIAHDIPMTCLSTVDSWFIESVPSVIPFDPLILLNEDEGYCWICPIENRSCEVYLLLPKPSIVMDIGITVAHGICVDTFPLLIDVFVGKYFDQCHVRFQNRQIARCSNGTKLYYNLSPPSSHSSRIKPNSPPLYDFHQEGNDNHFTRVVKIIFHGIPDSRHLTLGKIELFGTTSIDKYKTKVEETYQQIQQKYYQNLITNLAQSFSSSKATISLPSVAPPHSPSPLISNHFSEMYEASDMEVHIYEPEYDTDDLTQSDVNSFNSMNNSNISSRSLSDSGPVAPADYSAKTFEFSSEIIEDYNSRSSPVLTDEQLAVLKAAKEQYEQMIRLKMINFKPNDRLSLIEGNIAKHLKLLDILELEYFRITRNISTLLRNQIICDFSFPIYWFDPSNFIYSRNPRLEYHIRKIEKAKSSNCHVCGQSLRFSRDFQCFYCRKRVCSVHSHPQNYKVIEYQWNSLSPLCIPCFDIIKLQEKFITKIGQLVPQKPKLSPFLPNEQTMFELAVPTYSFCSNIFETNKIVCVSHFPNSAVLTSVPKSEGSDDIEIILSADTSSFNLQHFWYYRMNEKLKRKIDIPIVLSSTSFVSHMILLVDSLGYNYYDVPKITITAGKYFSKQKLIGDWCLQPTNGSPIADQTSFFEYQFPNPIECRIITLSFSFLNPLPSSNLEENNNISEEDNDGKSSRLMHIGRIKIFGKPTPVLPSLRSLSQLEYQSLQTILRVSPLQSRSMVRIAKSTFRLGRILDLEVESDTVVTGFTLVIKHNEEGISSQAKVVQVRSIKTNSKKVQREITDVIEIQTFVIPKAISGTQLSFDFPFPIRCNIITFEFISSYHPKCALCVPKIFLYNSIKK